MIFSTVRAPHDPAFTVGSLAITQTGRPSIAADARDHAVGREVAGECVGEQAVLDERVRDRAGGRAGRARTACSACRASRGSRLEVAGERARDVAVCALLLARGGVVGVAHACGVQPAARAGPHHLTGEVAADEVLGEVGGVDERVEIDTGVDVHVLEHVDQVLGDDVAGRARRVGAAAEPADRRVVARDAAAEAGEHVREAGAARVVEVQPDRRRRRHRRRRARRGPPRPGGASPSRWCRRASSGRRPPRTGR